MSAPEQRAERIAGLVLGTWLVFHQFLLDDPGPAAAVVLAVLAAGMLVRAFGLFPPVLAGRFVLAGAVVCAALLFRPSAATFGAGVGLLGAGLLLRPLSPGRGLWVLLCAILLLAAITLQESETVNGTFIVMDVAALMFIAQQIHTPPEAEVRIWDSLWRSLRLVIPVAIVVTMVFWLFPAISSQTTAAFVGYSGSNVLSPGDSSELRVSRRIAFVATFPGDGAVPAAAELYWRGQVLEKNEGLRWSRDAARINSAPAATAAPPVPATWHYVQKSERDGAFAALDRPIAVTALRDGRPASVLQTGGSVFSVFGTGSPDLEISSSSIPADDPPRSDIASGSLGVPEKCRNDPALQTLASKLLDSRNPLSQNLQSLGGFLENQGFIYTLKPGAMPPDDIAAFLLKYKKGYCEHYAAASAGLLRAGGIPARVVTGFRGGIWNPWLRTISVRDSDAHAWVEAWDEADGHWERFDPTSFVAPALSSGIEIDRDPNLWPWYRMLGSYAHAMFTQAGHHLKNLLPRPEVPVLWPVLVIPALVVGAVVMLWRRRKIPWDIEAICLARLEKQAALNNRPRFPGETPLAWLARLEQSSPGGSERAALREFAEIYEQCVYSAPGHRVSDVKSLRSLTSRLLRVL
ncbi:MAG: transglutaminase TgpA family protein [Terrimicrobiaceae bacterium]